MDERLLVKRAKRGDTAAFAELYGTIYRIADHSGNSERVPWRHLR